MRATKKKFIPNDKHSKTEFKNKKIYKLITVCVFTIMFSKWKLQLKVSITHQRNIRKMSQNMVGSENKLDAND